MIDLEKYIKENNSQFNCGELPQGHKDRFAQKLASTQTLTEEIAAIPAPKTRKISVIPITKVILSIAAVFIFAFILKNTTQKETPINYSLLLQQEGQEVVSLIQKSEPRIGEEMANTIDNILFEAIPLSDQLPQELPAKEREEILQKYYKAKVDGIKKIKTFLAQEFNNKK